MLTVSQNIHIHLCIFLSIFPISFKGKGISFKNLVQVEKKNEEKKSKELKLL